MYYLTVIRNGYPFCKNGEDVVSSKPFEDYGAAIAYTSQFYGARTKRCVLEFTTEVINGEFARSYAALTRPEDIDPNQQSYQLKRDRAAKQSNAFNYDSSYFFMIESDVGMRDSAAFLEEEDPGPSLQECPKNTNDNERKQSVPESQH